MKITQLKKTKRREAIVSVQVSKSEALSLIRSLTNQMIADNPNTGRLESWDRENGTYLTVAVMGDENWIEQVNDSNARGLDNNELQRGRSKR